jgi:hypothetical protein
MIVIPDVHSRKFYKQILENTTDKIIFLGDYGDPYSHEGWDDDDTIEAMMDIFSFAQDNPDRVILLIGNHDIPYYNGVRGGCRYNWMLGGQLEQIFTEYKNLFQIAYWDEETQTMFTHAGINKKWWDSLELPIDMTPKQIQDYLNNLLLTDKGEYNPLHEISRARGGWNWNGSCIWADVSEHLSLKKDETMPFNQIFGHSQLRDTGNIIHQNNWWMCDSRAIFEYDGENLKLYNNVDSE